MATYTWSRTTDSPTTDNKLSSPETAVESTDTQSLDTRPAPPRELEGIATDTQSLDIRPAPPKGPASINPPETYDTGVIVPGDFYRVNVLVVNETGDPIPETKWVMSTGTFPTAAKVNDNAEAELFLLPTTYEHFMAVVEDNPEEPNNLDYTWYSAETQEPINPLSLDNGEVVEIVLTPEEIEQETAAVARGLMVGRGLSLGL